MTESLCVGDTFVITFHNRTINIVDAVCRSGGGNIISQNEVIEEHHSKSVKTANKAQLRLRRESVNDYNTELEKTDIVELLCCIGRPCFSPSPVLMNSLNEFFT